jgi:hypothetical protein
VEHTNRVRIAKGVFQAVMLCFETLLLCFDKLPLRSLHTESRTCPVPTGSRSQATLILIRTGRAYNRSPDIRLAPATAEISAWPWQVLLEAILDGHCALPRVDFLPQQRQ